MFDLLDLIRKLLSQIIIGVRIIRWFGLMDELRYCLTPITTDLSDSDERNKTMIQ